MYTWKQRKKAVALYPKHGKRKSMVIRGLDYPNRHVPWQWVKEYEATGS